MDGIPSFNDAVNGSGNLSQDVANLAPLATSYHGAQTGVNIGYTAPYQPQGGVMQQFGHWLGGFASGVGNIAEGAAKWLGHTLTTAVEAPFKFSYDITKGTYDTYSQNSQVAQLDSQMQNLDGQWRSGHITTSQYQSGLKDILKQQDALRGQIQTNSQRLQNAKQEGINTVADILTLLVGPAAKTIDASVGAGATAKFLTSTSATPFLDSVEQGLTKIASDPAIFARLDPVAQKALQTSVAEVVANGAGMTSAQMARTAAVNVALKYPIYYSYMSSVGTQLYKELDQKKYGAATRTLAFNAALVLSGGPIGWALKNAGRVVGGLASKTFGQSSFIDTLSKMVGRGGDNMNGDAAGIYKAINNPTNAKDYWFYNDATKTFEHPTNTSELTGKLVNNWSANEATNMAATGNDPVAAAMRVGKGMENYEGLSLSQFSHEQLVANTNNFAEAQRYADTVAKASGLSGVTVVRADARDFLNIGQVVGPAMMSGDKAAAHAALDNLAAQSSTKAWANNPNVMHQLHNLIDKYNSEGEFANAMNRLSSSSTYSIYRYKESVRGMVGFPKEAVDNLAKIGYVPAKPVNLEAPFTEGTGKLATKFAGTDVGAVGKNVGDNFFLKSVQPLPVLGFVGDALTKMGLSPNASSERVYQIFNDNLAKNLQEAGAVQKIMGEDVSQSTDSLVKKLTEYANAPTHGKIASKLPITDLRMMTTKDVQAALEVSATDARAVQKAITQAYLQVPITIRGLGDKAVDLSYKVAGPVERRYLRLQGAARFSYNPFFQYLRVVPKTEILSSFEGGGFVSSIFRGQLGELTPIRDALRESGFLEKSGFGSVVSGEAVDAAGAVDKNLAKRLLPMQERSIAGLISSQAQKMGMDWQTYIKDNPDNVRSTIQMIAEYDKRANFLNSPLARTLNIAFFPFRFEAKVATIMARSLSRTSMMTQVAVVNGMLQAHNWLNSAEGQSWYARNASAIGFFEYITPAAELNSVFESLLPGHDHSLGNFGQLGGLPFGWIPMILDAEGLTHFNQPGVDAKTGAIYSSYVPATAKGQMAIAIQDFIGTLFSYPGSQVGLPSKTGVERNVALGVTGGNKKTDLKLNTPTEAQLSPQQRQYSQFIGSQQPGANQPAPDYNQAVQATQVPAQPSPLTQPKVKSSSGSSKKLKKAQFTPALLPGQTTLGQLP
jgi:hypothetical protein